MSILSTVNAIPWPHRLHKRATTFVKCPDNSPLLEITFFPDPVVPGANSTFTINGTPPNDITIGSAFGVGFLTSAGSTFIGTPFVVSTCDLVTCPSPAGVEFLIVVNVPAPAILPTTYNMIVLILDATGDITLGCAMANAVGGGGDGGGAPAPPPSSAAATGTGSSSPTSPSTTPSTVSAAPASSPTEAAAGGLGKGPGGIQDALKLFIFT